MRLLYFTVKDKKTCIETVLTEKNWITVDDDDDVACLYCSELYSYYQMNVIHGMDNVNIGSTSCAVALMRWENFWVWFCI